MDESKRDRMIDAVNEWFKSDPTSEEVNGTFRFAFGRVLEPDDPGYDPAGPLTQVVYDLDDRVWKLLKDPEDWKRGELTLYFVECNLSDYLLRMCDETFEPVGDWEMVGLPPRIMDTFEKMVREGRGATVLRCPAM
jgi:hypothetical protein